MHRHSIRVERWAEGLQSPSQSVIIFRAIAKFFRHQPAAKSEKVVGLFIQGGVSRVGRFRDTSSRDT